MLQKISASGRTYKKPPLVADPGQTRGFLNKGGFLNRSTPAMTVSLYRDKRFFVPRRLELGINIHPVPEFLVADELDLRSVREQDTGGFQHCDNEPVSRYG